MTILDQLSTRKKESSLAYNLECLATLLQSKVSEHLKRIIVVLPDFDLHDSAHSEKVLYNIEKLLGAETLASLSSIELFLLYAASYLHDCGMAPADWEINLFKLTEGISKFSASKYSINHDLKAPLKYTDAYSLIKQKKSDLYGDFSELKKWIFAPEEEEDLLEYMANLLLQYQQYRNGYREQLNKIKDQEEFDMVNKNIRESFIRTTHHSRSENYIINSRKIFIEKLDSEAWGEKIAKDLGSICKAHGEDVKFIDRLKSNEKYFECEGANLQFISMMLRLGDVIHFSSDRAPLSIRSAKIFKSQYSFLQWAVKDQGVLYSIENNEISFNAYCKSPELYFALHEYLDYIDYEIQNYFRYERSWQAHYIPNLTEKVNRSGITSDESRFQPQKGLCFRLNQQKIIELLMGVGLYKDKYACLRELYQNSLDACQCKLSKEVERERNFKAHISFWIDNDSENTYLCCLDNGLGMSKHIIEEYLLNIGNSYYKSSDFYRRQAQCGSTFTPISQFGIGILSCFMLGNQIKITTKTENEDYLSCVIEGPHEYFYYTKTDKFDEDLISVSGTLVKICLNEEVKNEISDRKINKYSLPYFFRDSLFPEEFASYKEIFNAYENHLYTKLQSFISVIPKGITVYVGENENRVELISLPTFFKVNERGVTDEDLDFIDYLSKGGHWKNKIYNYSDFKDKIDTYVICVSEQDVDFYTVLHLPKSHYPLHCDALCYIIPTKGSHVLCIEGVSVDTRGSLTKKYTDFLLRIGLLNFIGEKRPIISVDRTSIINFPEEYEEISEALINKLVKAIVDKTHEHISKNQLEHDTPIYNLSWDTSLGKISFAHSSFIAEVMNSERGNILWDKLSHIVGRDCTIKDFNDSSSLTLLNYKLNSYNALVRHMVIAKLASAHNIIVQKNEVQVRTNKQPYSIYEEDDFYNMKAIYIAADEWGLGDFDIVTDLYPLIPFRFFHLLEEFYEANERTKIVPKYSNSIGSMFEQNPLLVDEELGLYIEDSSFISVETNHVYNFQNKRKNIVQITDRRCPQSKIIYFIYVFISPRELSSEEESKLMELELKHPEYVKGVKEGWSILVTCMQKENTVIRAGIVKRDELVECLSEDFWKTYSDYEFKFTDGTEVLPR